MSVTVINPKAIQEGGAQDVSADLTKFDVAQQQVNLAVAALTPFLTITTVDQQSEALTICKDANAICKAIEAKRKELVKPFTESKCKIDSYARKLSEELELLVERVKGSILAFQKEEEKRARQALVTARQGQLAQLGLSYNSNSNCFELDGVIPVSMREVENYEQKQWDDLLLYVAGQIERKNRQQAEALMEEREMLQTFGTEEDVTAIDSQIAQATAAPVVAPIATSPVVDPLKGTTKRWTFEITDANQIPREYLVVDESKIRIAIREGVREIPGTRIYQSESLTLR